MIALAGSLSCIPDEANSSDSVRALEDISALRNGSEMSTWRFTVYWQTDRYRDTPEIIPASVKEEVMMSVNDLALITGLLKNAK